MRKVIKKLLDEPVVLAQAIVSVGALGTAVGLLGEFNEAALTATIVGTVNTVAALVSRAKTVPLKRVLAYRRKGDDEDE